MRATIRVGNDGASAGFACRRGALRPESCTSSPADYHCSTLSPVCYTKSGTVRLWNVVRGRFRTKASPRRATAFRRAKRRRAFDGRHFVYAGKWLGQSRNRICKARQARTRSLSPRHRRPRCGGTRHTDLAGGIEVTADAPLRGARPFESPPSPHVYGRFSGRSRRWSGGIRSIFREMHFQTRRDGPKEGSAREESVPSPWLPQQNPRSRFPPPDEPPPTKVHIAKN